MFERFTERARQVVVLAQNEARALKHNYIGTEHLLLGLLREEEGLAARVLESMDVTIEDTRAQVARIIGVGDDVTTGQMPLTPRAKKVLELSLRESKQLGHSYIGTEHILLGVLREGDGVASHVLTQWFRLESDEIRRRVLEGVAGAQKPTSRAQFEVGDPDDPTLAEAPRHERAAIAAGGARQEFDRRPRRRGVAWLPAAVGGLCVAVGIGVGRVIWG